MLLEKKVAESEKAWAFASPAGGAGIFYSGGYYIFAASDNDFNPSVNLGTANSSYAAHAFIVTAGGAGTGDTVIRVTGTSINDTGTRVTSDTQDLTIASAEAADTYHETSKKWIGQIAIEKISGDDVLCNYGLCKYWDSNNNDFTVVGVEATGRAGANDSAPDILLRHHKATGWTYNNGSTPTPPSAIASMDTDHSTESQFVNSENFAWKRSNLSTDVNGSDSEGTIIEWVTSANRAIETANFLLRIK